MEGTLFRELLLRAARITARTFTFVIAVKIIMMILKCAISAENEDDKDWATTWGIVEYRKDTNKYHFVKWIQED